MAPSARTAPRLEHGQGRQQRGRRARGVPAGGERAGKHGHGHGAEAERRRGRGDAVAGEQQRAGVGEHAGPGGVGQQLAGGEARDVAAAATPRSSRRCASSRRPAGAAAAEPAWPARRPSGTASQAARQPYAATAPDDRHADDPGRRHPGDRPGEHVRPPGGGRPLAGRGDADGDQQADPDADDALRGRQHGERRRGGAQPRSPSDERGAGAEQVAQAGAATGDRQDTAVTPPVAPDMDAQLPRRRGRDAELASDVRQHGREHEQRRLRGEQAEEEHRARTGQQAKAWHTPQQQARGACRAVGARGKAAAAARVLPGGNRLVTFRP